MQTAELRLLHVSNQEIVRRCGKIIGVMRLASDPKLSFRSDRELFRIDRYVARYGYMHPLAGMVNEAIHTLANWHMDHTVTAEGHFNDVRDYGEGGTWSDLVRVAEEIDLAKEMHERVVVEGEGDNAA